MGSGIHHSRRSDKTRTRNRTSGHSFSELYEERLAAATTRSIRAGVNKSCKSVPHALTAIETLVSAQTVSGGRCFRRGQVMTLLRDIVAWARGETEPIALVIRGDENHETIQVQAGDSRWHSLVSSNGGSQLLTEREMEALHLTLNNGIPSDFSCSASDLLGLGLQVDTRRAVPIVKRAIDKLQVA